MYMHTYIATTQYFIHDLFVLPTVDVPCPSTSPDDCHRSTTLMRSRSAQSLKQLQDSPTQDDKLTILAQMFWIAVSLLESDYEYEFLLAVRLLDKVLYEFLLAVRLLDKVLYEFHFG